MSWFALAAWRGRLARAATRAPACRSSSSTGSAATRRRLPKSFPTATGYRRLTLECRGQGRSPAGDVESYSIATFADDVLAFADWRGVERFVVGGISMGAAIALRIAARHPERVIALVLARPAWLWHAAPANMQPYAEVAAHLRNPDARRALADFEASDTAHRLAREAPGNLDAMRKFLAVEDRQGTGRAAVGHSRRRARRQRSGSTARSPFPRW